MSNALFGGAGAGQSRSRNLVEFKAGKMSLKGTMVQPDKRKGLVYVHQSEDSLMHFCWKDRSSGIVEDDLIIFPDDIEVKRVQQCATGRVYLMKFKSSNKKFFFWMQENDTEKDEKLWKKVNDSLNNPPVPGSASSTASGGGGGAAAAAAAAAAANFSSALGDFGGLEGADLQSLIGSMSEQQLQMFLGGLMPVNSPSSNRSGGSSSLSSNQTSRAASTASATPAAAAKPPSAVPATPAPAGASAAAAASAVAATPVKTTTAEAAAAAAAEDVSGGKKMQFSEFQSILGNIAQSARSDLDLSEVLSQEVMAPILSNKQIQEKLVQYLPDSDILPKTEFELRTTLTTPQFKKAMSSFSHALQSGQLGPLLNQFNLPLSVQQAAAAGNLEAFAKAMEEHAQQQSSSTSRKEVTEDDMDTK